jgi:hypothetical protein
MSNQNSENSSDSDSSSTFIPPAANSSSSANSDDGEPKSRDSSPKKKKTTKSNLKLLKLPTTIEEAKLIYPMNSRVDALFKDFKFYPATVLDFFDVEKTIFILVKYDEDGDEAYVNLLFVRKLNHRKKGCSCCEEPSKRIKQALVKKQIPFHEKKEIPKSRSTKSSKGSAVQIPDEFINSFILILIWI